MGPSTLPAVRHERRPDGIALIRDPREGATGLAPFGAGMVGGFVTLIALFVVGWSSAALFVAGVVAVLSGVITNAAIKRHRRLTLGDAELLLPRLPLRMGEDMTVRYTQPRTGRAPVLHVWATVSCNEWVRYKSGTDTSTQTHDLWQYRLDQPVADPLEAAAVIEGTWRLLLPPELPPSFSAPDNAITWRLTIEATFEGRPSIRNAFVLPVAPEVVRDLR